MPDFKNRKRHAVGIDPVFVVGDIKHNPFISTAVPELVDNVAVSVIERVRHDPDFAGIDPECQTHFVENLCFAPAVDTLVFVIQAVFQERQGIDFNMVVKITLMAQPGSKFIHQAQAFLKF